MHKCSNSSVLCCLKEQEFPVDAWLNVSLSLQAKKTDQGGVGQMRGRGAVRGGGRGPARGGLGRGRGRGPMRGGRGGPLRGRGGRRGRF